MRLLRRLRRADPGEIVEPPAAKAPDRPAPEWPDAPVICPECGSEQIGWDPTCHTYQQGGSWMACMPCDSAIRYYCRRPACTWRYTHGLNPANPRSVTNQASRPPWLPAGLPHDRHGPGQAHPGARSARDGQHDDH